MTQPVIVIPDDDPVYYGSPEHPDIERLKAHGTVRFYDRRAADRAEFFRRIADADVVINVRGHSRFDAEALGQAPRLRLISVVGTGVDNIDLAAATARGVRVANTPGVNIDSVAEVALGLMLAVARSIPRGDVLMREGVWRQIVGPELRGRTVGLLGLGLIGQRFAQLCQCLGMRTIGWSQTFDQERADSCRVELVERDRVFSDSDVVSLHIRSTPATRGFVGRRELALMRPTAILVNTARGAVVDHEALLETLQEGRIFGAGLDVHVPEPLPLELNLLKGCDNVVMTPHTGGSTWEAIARTQRLTVDNVIAFLRDRPAHIVNPPTA